jgi:hypothetical protein
LGAKVLEGQDINTVIISLDLPLREVNLEFRSSVCQHNWFRYSKDTVGAFESELFNRDFLKLGALIMKSVLNILNVIVSQVEFLFKNMKGFALTVYNFDG